MQRPSSAPADLTDELCCVWTATMSAGERLVPDGCVDLVWIEEQGELWVCGPEREAWISPMPAGTRAAGVRMRPGSAPRLLRTDANRLADQRVPIDDVLTARAGRLLRDRLADSSEPLEVFVAELRAWRDSSDGRTPSDAHILEAAAGPRAVRVGALADEIGITPRQLHRRSERLFGYGYSVLVRLLRFQRFLHTARRRPGLPLAQTAAIAGYADQSHLDHECRSITGLTPTALLSESEPTFPLETSDPYKTEARPSAPLAV